MFRRTAETPNEGENFSAFSEPSWEKTLLTDSVCYMCAVHRGCHMFSIRSAALRASEKSSNHAINKQIQVGSARCDNDMELLVVMIDNEKGSSVPPSLPKS